MCYLRANCLARGFLVGYEQGHCTQANFAQQLDLRQHTCSAIFNESREGLITIRRKKERHNYHYLPSHLRILLGVMQHHPPHQAQCTLCCVSRLSTPLEVEDLLCDRGRKRASLCLLASPDLCFHSP